MIVCSVCNLDDDPDNLLICKSCSKQAMHLGCFDPPLTATPVDGFQCDQCSESRQMSGDRREEKQAQEVEKKKKKKNILFYFLFFLLASSEAREKADCADRSD